MFERMHKFCAFDSENVSSVHLNQPEPECVHIKRIKSSFLLQNSCFQPLVVLINEIQTAALVFVINFLFNDRKNKVRPFCLIQKGTFKTLIQHLDWD